MLLKKVLDAQSMSITFSQVMPLWRKVKLSDKLKMKLKILSNQSQRMN